MNIGERKMKYEVVGIENLLDQPERGFIVRAEKIDEPDLKRIAMYISRGEFSVSYQIPPLLGLPTFSLSNWYTPAARASEGLVGSLKSSVDCEQEGIVGAGQIWLEDDRLSIEMGYSSTYGPLPQRVAADFLIPIVTELKKIGVRVHHMEANPNVAFESHPFWESLKSEER